MSFLKPVARPSKIDGIYIWYADGGNNNLCDPANGILPLEICRHLKGTKQAKPGSGGHWYYSRADAYLDLERIVNLILSSKIRPERTL